MSVVMHPSFVKSTEGSKLSLRIIYLDEGHGVWSVSHGGREYTVTNTDTGIWKEAVWEVRGTDSLNGNDACRLVEQGMITGKNKARIQALVPDITIKSIKGSTVFHMVEVCR